MAKVLSHSRILLATFAIDLADGTATNHRKAKRIDIRYHYLQEDNPASNWNVGKLSVTMV
jgi:hypothetical protein